MSALAVWITNAGGTGGGWGSSGRARLGVLVALFTFAAALSAMFAWMQVQAAQDRAITLTVAAQEARTQVPARGTVIIRSPATGAAQGVHARVHHGAGRTVIQYLDGPARDVTVFKDGHRVWRNGHASPPPFTLDTGAQEPRMDRALLHRNYVARVLGQEEIAGRKVTHVALRRRSGRDSLHLWVDRETGFPLRRARVDGDGKVVSDTVFSDVDFTVPPPSLPEPPRGPGHGGVTLRPTTAADASRALGFTVLQPSYIPGGFRAMGWQLHLSRNGRPRAAELRHTDGLAHLSVLQMLPGRRMDGRGERDGAGRPGRGMGGEGPGRKGPPGSGLRGSLRLGHHMAPPGSSVRRTVGDVQIVVMGDLPQAVLQRVADSM